MKCVYHTDREAAGICGTCRKPLCEECSLKQTDGETLCSQCAALSAAQDAVTGHEERQAAHEERKAKAARKAKKPHVAMTVILILAGLVLLANVYMYMGPNTPDVPQYDPNQYPLVTAELVNEGLNNYANANGGKYPGSLDVLLHEYIPFDQITPSVLEMFSYVRLSPTSYELRFRDQDNVEYRDIVFGKEDL
jgi:transcription initiation factor TFIIIB Brf1 subunit/transcription initiation factor TFIIB